jgi:Family of unknown function (DUF5955)
MREGGGAEGEKAGSERRERKGKSGSTRKEQGTAAPKNMKFRNAVACAKGASAAPDPEESHERDGRREPRAVELAGAVARLRRELVKYPAEFTDRGVAEDELAALAAMIEAGTTEIARMRRSLLLIVGSIGSVSALSPALMEVRAAVEMFGDAPGRNHR